MAVFAPPVDSSSPLKFDGSWCPFSGIVTTGIMKQRIPYQVTSFFLTKMANCTPSIERNQAPFESLGLPVDLVNTSPAVLDDVILSCQEYSTQMNNAKCNKTSCLNAFNTSLMPTLSYRMIVTQFIEQQ